MRYSVFTKAWQKLPVDELCKKVSNWGFDGVELPLRPGYQVEPKDAEKSLPALAKKMQEYGLSVMSVASGTDENIFAACQAAGVPVIRILPWFGVDKGYFEYEDGFRSYLYSLQIFCEKYNVKIAVQNHSKTMIFNSMELRSVLQGLDPALIGAAWDAGHCGLAGETGAKGLEIVWPHLIQVNLKNAYWKPITGPEAEEATWQPHLTLGRYGMASFPKIISYLKARGYTGAFCVFAEYTEESQVDRLTPMDLQYIKSLYEHS